MNAMQVWEKVDTSAGLFGCWPWQGTTSQGYGSVSVNGRTRRAHRFIWETVVGPVPAGLTLDHLCHNEDETCNAASACPHRRCVNPVHLEPVPSAVNTLRGRGFSARNARLTRCPSGHEYSPENTYYPPRGGRICRACHRAEHDARWARQEPVACPNCDHRVRRHSFRRHLREVHGVNATPERPADEVDG